MDDIENKLYADTIDRAKFFQTVHAWPLSDNLNYAGWLSNFKDDQDLEIACHILDFFTYFSTKAVDEMFKAAIGYTGHFLSKQFSDWKHSDFINRCIYSFIPGETQHPTDSGNLFTRKLRDVLNIPEDHIVDYQRLLYLLDVYPTPIPVILVDDFVGSGAQVDHAWNRNTSKNYNGLTLSGLVAKGGHTVVYAPLICNNMGYNRIVTNCQSLHLSPTHILGKEYCLFEEECYCWKGDKQLYNKGVELILRKSKELGIPSTNGRHVNDEMGFGKQGLAIAFEHGMPDAVSAFFYWKGINWEPLINKQYSI